MMRPAALLFVLPVLAAEVPIRVGLDTQGVEWVVSLEGGGQLQTRDGHPILDVAPGEKIRIWWDSRGEADPTDEYRVQVGPPLAQAQAAALMGRLEALGHKADREPVADGGTWRVLVGHYESAEAAQPLLEALGAKGYEELWVSTQSRKAAPRKGRALYAVTERYERHPLPEEGVRLHPEGECVTIVGKGRYRGRVEIFPNAQGRLTVLDTLDLETYLKGVVPREMGAWEYPALEALKAQAVAARTYAYANRGKRAKEGFDLVDTVADQVYGGRDGEQALTDRAVDETRGLVATYGGQPIQALFMADSGGATVDNVHVFGDGCPYLQGATNYRDAPLAIPFTGSLALPGDTPWLTMDLLRMAALGAVPPAWLEGSHLGAPCLPAEALAATDAVARHLGLPGPGDPPPGAQVFLWMARALGLGDVVEGMERPQDGRYFLGTAPFPEADLPLAAFLVRRALVPPAALSQGVPSLRTVLQTLGRMWQELEPLDLAEGTLLRDGLVRRKGGGPEQLDLAQDHLLAEEAPGGSLRLVASSAVQVGDRLKWLAGNGPSPLLVRRLDPDGASLDRYNPMAHWKVEIKEKDLLDRLAQKAGIHHLDRMELTHNAQGRVLELVVLDGGRAHRFTGMRIRNLLGLKDNVFRFVQLGGKPDRRWIFYGRGWGHGVGMDQTGAYGMALEGATCEQILHYYYQGIQLEHLDR
jgi:stage II sporulation protein D